MVPAGTEETLLLKYYKGTFREADSISPITDLSGPYIVDISGIFFASVSNLT